MNARIIQGDVRGGLGSVEAGSVQCVVTSPPYWGLRDYGHDGQIGLEQTPDEYVEQMVAVFREVWRVLADDGALWLNLGDSYSGSGKGAYADGVVRLSDKSGKQATSRGTTEGVFRKADAGLKPKDLVGIPWRVAFALQADGWYLRQDIIWHKPNPMPESVTDRCTKSHEYLFMLTKNARYYFDNQAIAEPIAQSTIDRVSQPNLDQQEGSWRQPGKTNGPMRAVVGKSGNKQRKPATGRGAPRDGVSGNVPWEGTTRNKRSVWSITTKPFKGAHFAVMPEALVEPCILAASRPNDLILDPFTGSGTVAVVALRHERRFVGTELNPAYVEIAERRIADSNPLFAQVEVVR